MKSSRGISLANQGLYEDGAAWAIRATQQPNAHFHIYAVDPKGNIWMAQSSGEIWRAYLPKQVPNLLGQTKTQAQAAALDVIVARPVGIVEHLPFERLVFHAVFLSVAGLFYFPRTRSHC